MEKNTYIVENEVPKERLHNVYTYENTKGMSNEDVDKYFSSKSEEERSQIKFSINISNNFSEDNIANEAIFEEAKTKLSLKDRQQFSIELALETQNFSLGTPTINNVLRVSPEFWDAIGSGIANPRELGIFINAADKALYESGQRGINYNETKFSSSEATDYISTMFNLAKQRMEESKGSPVYDDYKTAFERYERIYNTYTEKLEAQKVNINV
ncbi:hypothetical protein CRV03_06965 [Arcobacter sp. F155]|uniref:hypothetical protein n=1 Tax=Arcobacter sp. F155 TaxID=2044512 RepID=UPI00100BD9FF|nr:hypothetical protein [Arcobacter sp. F155]RXJ76998.1 hypothetical protein CRV03_06965 [Arcobacter sp. F155]